MGSLSLLQGIFPTQGLNPGLLHARWILYQLSHKGSPWILEWVAYPFSSRSSWPRSQTGISCIASGFFINWAIREVSMKKYRFMNIIVIWELQTITMKFHFAVVVQSLSWVWFFATPWTAIHQASLSFTVSWSLLKLMSIESMVPSNYLILCCLLSCSQSFPASVYFPMSWLFSSGAESTRASASATTNLLCNIMIKI